jgi:type IV secretion system protein TrbG
MTRPFIRSALLGTASALLVAADQPDNAPAREALATTLTQTNDPTSSTRTYSFNDGTIYPVRTAPGRVTDIALQPGEVLGAVASGDTARWIVGDTTSGSGETLRAHVLVKPFATGLSTNLIITTDRRVYHLTVSSGSRDAMSSVAWTYPRDALMALQRARETKELATPVASGVRVEQLRFDYAISGDRPSWRPIRAFDDGRQTFIEFPPTFAVGEAPPLFLVGAQGEAQLVNYRLSGRHYVVDRLFDVAELRLGTRKQQIVRITRTEGGARTDTAKRRAS